MNLTISELRDTAAARWDAYVRACPSASFSHLTAWKRTIEKTWGHRAHYLYAEREGQIVGVLPLFRVKSVFGSSLLSLPNAVYGGAAADDTDVAAALIDRAKELATSLRVKHLELRDDAVAPVTGDPDLHRKDLYVSFDHPITTDDDALMKSFPRDIRRMIRQGSQHGLTVEFGREALATELYDAYATTVHRLGTPVFPRRLFTACLREFGDACDILVVRKEGRTAAAVLNFYFRDTVFPYYSGSYPEFNRFGVNNFMYYELMRSAARRGCTVFAFGRSKEGTGACEFKRGWRMRERPLPYKFYLVTGKRVPDLNPLNPKMGPLVNAWRRLPAGIARLLGPTLVRHLP